MTIKDCERKQLDIITNGVRDFWRNNKSVNYFKEKTQNNHGIRKFCERVSNFYAEHRFPWLSLEKREKIASYVIHAVIKNPIKVKFTGKYPHVKFSGRIESPINGEIIKFKSKPTKSQKEERNK